MQYLRTILTVACVLAICGCANVGGEVLPPSVEAQTTCGSVQTSGADVEEIRRLEMRGAQSNVEGWTIDEARSFFGAEWVSVAPDGSVSGLDAVLSSFQDGRSQPWAGRFDIVELDIRVYCDMAIVVGAGEAYRIGAAEPTDRPAVRFRWLNVWRRQNDRWVYVANQFARY